MPATPLHDVHHDLGAVMTDFAGWSMPLRYGSEIVEHHAVRRAAGLFDLSHMGEITVRGPQAAAALDWALVGTPSAMPVGKARYTMIVAEDGGILDDLVVYRLDPDTFMVVANAGNSVGVSAALTERTAHFTASVHDDSTEWALVAVQGPAAAAIVEQAVGHEVASLKYYAICATSVGGPAVWLARTGYTGEDGFEMYCPAYAAEAIWRALVTVGGAHGLVPAGLACRDSLRLEAGMPLYGRELTTRLTPYDVGLGRVVALDKPDGFVGSEVLAAASMRPPAHRLVGLRGHGHRAPRTGHPVMDPRTGTRVGAVTSGIPSPTLGHPIAMALLTETDVEVGDHLTVDVRGNPEQVEIVTLPFYTRAR